MVKGSTNGIDNWGALRCISILVYVKNTGNTVNNTGFMDEFPSYCILFYGIQSHFVLYLQY